MTFDEIRAANAAMGTIDIKGKQYTPVNQRVMAFRMCYPTGTIDTEIVSHENDVIVMKATVGVGQTILGVGYAFEAKNSSNINRTSYIENCQTSAVGRALGFAGFGVDASIASAEEKVNADIAEVSLAQISKVKAGLLEKRCDASGVDPAKLLASFGVYDFEELNEQQHSQIINNWEKVEKKFKLKKEDE